MCASGLSDATDRERGREEHGRPAWGMRDGRPFSDRSGAARRSAGNPDPTSAPSAPALPRGASRAMAGAGTDLIVRGWSCVDEKQDARGRRELP